LVRQEIWHIEVRNEKNSFFCFHIGQTGQEENYLILTTFIRRWKIIESLTLVLLVLLRIRLGSRWWDVVNVHVAYPILRFPRFFRFLFGKQVVITEHWSAYHSCFHLPKGNPGRRRIEQIFHQHIPVVAVSQALMNDILCFAGTNTFPRYIVPNVVDPKVFHPLTRPPVNSGRVFLMVGSWAPIKQPLLAIAAFAGVVKQFPSARLRVVGAGAQFKAMQEFVSNHNLEDQIILLGPLSKAAVANEMQQADCFLHPSDYETFSVVCAEALCCGLPVIASNVGGIPEFLNETNGFLLENTEEEWESALLEFIKGDSIWDRQKISAQASSRFNPHAVAKQFLVVFNALASNAN